MSELVSLDTPTYAVPEDKLNRVDESLHEQYNIPPSRMFLINKSLRIYREKYPTHPVFDASQGDGGASLPGVPKSILERAAQMQIEHGTKYDMPFGTNSFRETVIEKYWQLDPALGIGPNNVIATCGGRDALVKAYQAMLALGHGRSGDVSHGSDQGRLVSGPAEHAAFHLELQTLRRLHGSAAGNRMDQHVGSGRIAGYPFSAGAG